MRTLCVISMLSLAGVAFASRVPLVKDVGVSMSQMISKAYAYRGKLSAEYLMERGDILGGVPQPMRIILLKKMFDLEAMLLSASDNWNVVVEGNGDIIYPEGDDKHAIVSEMNEIFGIGKEYIPDLLKRAGYLKVSERSSSRIISDGSDVDGETYVNTSKSIDKKRDALFATIAESFGLRADKDEYGRGKRIFDVPSLSEFPPKLEQQGANIPSNIPQTKEELRLLNKFIMEAQALHLAFLFYSPLSTADLLDAYKSLLEQYQDSLPEEIVAELIEERKKVEDSLRSEG